MAYETVMYTKEAHIATLTLNRPDVLNALNDTMIEETLTVIDGINRDEDVRALIVTGAGRGFSAGADVEYLESSAKAMTQVPFTETGVGRHMRDKPTAFTISKALRQLGKPVIAAINGVTAGIAISIILACDIRIAADNARFAMAFVKRGLIPDGGASYSLPRLVGYGMACKLIFTGDVIDTQEAIRIGMIEEVVPPEDLMPHAQALGKCIAQNPPLAVRMAKRVLQTGADAQDFETQVNREVYIQNALFATDDFAEGVRSFLEKRPPQFTGG